MKIISWNLNGLMATIRNGAFAPLADISPDVLCLQEIRTAQEPVIDDLVRTIETNRRSQRELILLLNRKLKGWAGYHRYTDALPAFRKVDAAVQAALLDAAIKKHPNMG